MVRQVAELCLKWGRSSEGNEETCWGAGTTWGWQLVRDVRRGGVGAKLDMGKGMNCTTVS